MGIFLGVDLQTRNQSICWIDTAQGEIHEARLDHQRDDIRGFYEGLPAPAVIGVESTGYALWFHKLVEELGHTLLVGDALAIRQLARRRQKNDRRDASLVLDLLIRGDFPAVHVPSAASRQVITLLRYRRRLVRIRTTLKNGLQAVALNHQLRLGARLFSAQGKLQLSSLPLTGASAIEREHSLQLIMVLDQRLGKVDQELEACAQKDARVQRLRTHPGVGVQTALAVVHFLEPVSRFRRARQLSSYSGLDPVEHSSGDHQRYGHISKQGNRLLRFLLIEAAHQLVRRGQDPDLRRFYYRLWARKNSSVAIVAVARKLLLRLYRMLCEQIDYEEFRRRGRDAGSARSVPSPAFAVTD